MTTTKTLIAALGAGLVLAAATSAVATPPPPPPHAQAAPVGGKLSVDSAISDLLANARTRPVMDRHFPKMADHPHFAMFKDSSLREIAPMSQGKLDDAVLAKINAELAAAQ